MTVYTYVGHGGLFLKSVHPVCNVKGQSGGFTFIHSAKSLSVVITVRKNSFII